MSSFRLYYKTGWVNPGLRYSAGQGWQDVQFKPVAHEYQWSRVDIEIGQARSIECVPHNAELSQWDNTPGGGNYHFELSTGKNVFVLRDGDIGRVENGVQAKALVADLDGTMIGHNDGIIHFRKFWDLTCRFAKDREGQRLWHIVYNTGRNLKDLRQAAIENDLPRPSFCIAGVGTEIYCPSPLYEGGPWYEGPLDWVGEWKKTMENCFGERAQLASTLQALFPALVIHGNEEFDPFRLPMVLELEEEVVDVISHPTLLSIREFCRERSLEMIISGEGKWRFIDVCPSEAGKGRATQFLVEKRYLPVSASSVLCAGDSGNDLSMLNIVGFKGVIVGNTQGSLLQQLELEKGDGKGVEEEDKGRLVRAHPELYYAKGEVAFGVMEAMNFFFGFGN